MNDASRAPLRPIRYASPAIVREKSPDGSVRLYSSTPLQAYDPSLARLFRAAVAAAPGRTFLAERSPDGNWRRVSYEQARGLVDALATALIARGLSAERPVMILSGNAVDHALLMLAGHTAGIPVAPISVAYSLQSQDHAKLKHVAELLRPGLVYVADTGPFAKALAALDLGSVEIVASRNSANLDHVTLFDQLDDGHARRSGRSRRGCHARRHDRQISLHLRLDRHAQRRDQHPRHVDRQPAAAFADLAFLADDDPLVLVDWLPWNHTFGGNHNFNLVLRHAGTLYIDGGRPLPEHDRRIGAQPDRDFADGLFQRAGGLWRPAAAPRT